jgi:hypothetical protein
MRLWNVGMALLCLVSFVLFWLVVFWPQGRMNKWSNTKSMHFTRNKNSFSWVSIFPSQVYLEKQNAVMYRTVDGVLDKQDVSANEAHGFQITGSFGILTNVSSNVYISALVVIYLLSSLDAALYGNPDTAHHKERHIYFTWGTCAVGAVFLIVHILWMFGSWHEIEWGTGGTKVPVTFSWESGASLLYASLVVALYIVHINVKNGVWYSIIPGISDTDAFHKAHHTGTEETGPVSKEASVVFAVSFFLLIMGLLGDTRSTVLETEAQLLVLCAVGLSVITLLSMRIRAYFDYVQEIFMGLDDMQEHKMMVRHALQLVDVITLAVTLTLFGVAFNVLATMFESDDYSMLFFVVIVVTGVYMLIKVAQTVAEMFDPHATMISMHSWTRAYKYQYVLMILAVLLLVFLSVFSGFTGDSEYEDLRQIESAQYAGMHSSDLKVNTACTTNGVQSNGLLHDFLAVKSGEKYDMIPVDNTNPVNFKVFAWTRWWELKAGQSTAQGPELYFCSTGMEQEFGACRRQYAQKPGVLFDEKFQTFVNTVKESLATSPT